MIKNVLLVDDDVEMLLALKEGLRKYEGTFSVLLAEDGIAALEVLKKSIVSLVVTDLKMPRMDGFGLLTHIMEHYPHIPVIMITGYSTPEMERLAREGGAFGYIAKPFLIENLARQIMTTLRKESEGGSLHNVSSGMFLQLIEMEQKTCTIRLEDKSSGKKGILFFNEGELFDARIDRLQGKDAAHEIFSWEQVNLSIQNGCALKENRIESDLQPLILEAMRKKDENGSRPASAAPRKANGQRPADSSTLMSEIKEKLQKQVGPSCGLEDIYQDSYWDERATRLAKVGKFFNLGQLILGYIDKGEASDYIILPGEKTTVVSIDPKCPRDKILRVLSS